MAKLSAHGEVLQKLEYSTYTLAIMSDGKILRNHGGGWKKYKKVKEGINVREYAIKAKAGYEEMMRDCPAYAEYVKLMHDEFSLKDRWKAKTILEMLANDPDGVWAEINDMMNISIDVDTVVALCRAYEQGMKELNARRQQIAESKEGKISEGSK